MTLTKKSVKVCLRNNFVWMCFVFIFVSTLKIGHILMWQISSDGESTGFEVQRSPVQILHLLNFFVWLYSYNACFIDKPFPLKVVDLLVLCLLNFKWIKNSLLVRNYISCCHTDMTVNWSFNDVAILPWYNSVSTQVCFQCCRPGLSN